jgi:hypothetical protein
MMVRDHAERATRIRRNWRRTQGTKPCPIATRNLYRRRTQPKTFGSRLRYKSGLTPGITRRPAPLKVDESVRVGGRVHAVVRRAGRQNDYERDIVLSMILLGLSSKDDSSMKPHRQVQGTAPPGELQHFLALHGYLLVALKG